MSVVGIVSVKIVYKELGIFELGYEKVKVLTRLGTGGDFETMPKDDIVPILSVGLDNTNFRTVFAWLCHEAIELSMVRHGVRYSKTGTVAKDNGEYTFMLEHTVYSDVVACASELILEVQNPLHKAWVMFQKEQKK